MGTKAGTGQISNSAMGCHYSTDASDLLSFSGLSWLVQIGLSIQRNDGEGFDCMPSTLGTESVCKEGGSTGFDCVVSLVGKGGTESVCKDRVVNLDSSGTESVCKDRVVNLDSSGIESVRKDRGPDSFFSFFCFLLFFKISSKTSVSSFKLNKRLSSSFFFNVIFLLPRAVFESSRPGPFLNML